MIDAAAAVAMLPYLGHQALFGAIAAAGFGVLFNFGGRALVWCAVAGALALAVRTLGQQTGISLEAASFVAAAVTSCAAIQSRRWLGVACHAIALAGCIPMVPGAFFGQALLGFMSVTGVASDHTVPTIVTSVQAFVRVISTVGAIGAGLTIPAYLLRSREF
ncbi:conserved hypothetical protein [Rhodopseudomonas palustris BisB18]|uniref:Threonine/Serine exporter ThrE domain-containing protein n=2 Tax=Rhodopseudomonas palustris TaxID=1076 RepID=Q213J6_RHOPB